MDAFKVVKNGKHLDYRVGQTLDLNKVREELSERFEILELSQSNRHVIGTVKKDGNECILKLSTSEGISIRTQTEKLWNDEFNKYSKISGFIVPKNITDGATKDGLYYIVMQKLEGPPISGSEGNDNTIEKNLDKIIDFAEYIQTLPINIPVNDAIQEDDHRRWFQAKTKSWYEGFPESRTSELESLWIIVEEGADALERRPRHGDFTPWHMIVTENGLGLIDGEHAHSHGIEYYDIAYFIQRVHSILKLPELAQKITEKLLERGYNREKLRTVLASRGIGGFLDESFKATPNYTDELDFVKLIQGL